MGMPSRFKRISLLLLLCSFGFIMYHAQKDKPIAMPSLLNLHSPTPAPFTELTIPALRARSYQSNLGELKQIGTNTNYTSYLTSYSSDGLQINGLLTKPKENMPPGGWPAIVFVHGYISPSLYKTTEKYVAYVDSLAKAGFVVFKIDLRGHDNSEGEPEGVYYSSAYVIDTLNARAALQSTNFINHEKIGMWGHSMAGNIVFRTLVVAKNIPATVIWAGAGYTYEDLQKFRINDASYHPPQGNTDTAKKREQLFHIYGNFDAANEFWRQIIPTNYVEGVTSALQLHHAQDDTVVDIGYSRNLITKLDGTNIAHELYEYPTGGHNISGTSFTLAMSRTIQFFKQHLGSE